MGAVKKPKAKTSVGGRLSALAKSEEKPVMSRDQFTEITHPLAVHKLSYMRQNTEKCPSRLFVRLMKEIGMVMAVEVMGRLYKASEDKPIEGIGGDTFNTKVLEGKKPVIIPILRSGLIMAEGMQETISTNFTGHIGIYHGEERKPIRYLSALPSLPKPTEKEPIRYFFLVDPVVATGATACLAIQTLRDYGVPSDKIRLVSLMIGTVGQQQIALEHPDVDVFCIKKGLEMDGKRLRDGLGSVSDRQFRTI